MIKNLLQKYPEIAVFLTLALGFMVGVKSIFFRCFSLLSAVAGCFSRMIGPRAEERHGC